MNYRRMVPNSISGLSLILGVVSIFLTIDHNFHWAAIFIILAVLADSCDGRAARLLGVSGEFGKELDSLCDLCSFGVAPAILIYVYGLQDLGVVGQVIAALYTLGELCVWLGLMLMPRQSTATFKECLYQLELAYLQLMFFRGIITLRCGLLLELSL